MASALPIILLAGAAAYFLKKKKDADEGRPLPDIDDGSEGAEAAFFGKYGFEGEADAMHAMGLLGFESIEHMGQWMGEPVSDEWSEQVLEWLRNGMDLYEGGAWETPEPMGG